MGWWMCVQIDTQARRHTFSALRLGIKGWTRPGYSRGISFKSFDGTCPGCGALLPSSFGSSFTFSIRTVLVQLFAQLLFSSSLSFFFSFFFWESCSYLLLFLWYENDTQSWRWNVIHKYYIWVFLISFTVGFIYDITNN